MDNLLTVDNLSIGFKSGPRVVEVVSSVSFSVRRGEMLALVGESGCGKSASCLSVAGLLPTPPAVVRADKIGFGCGGNGIVDISKLPEAGLRRFRGGRIAYIFQEPAASLNPVMKIGAQIAEVLKLHRPDISDRRAEIISLLKQVGIPAPESRADAYPHELSGGMQQRVMIAMALAGNPELLIADEPTTALDVTVQAQIMDLLDTLRRERNMAVILISHNLGLVSALADRVAVMYAGTIVESGTVRDILDRPLHPYTKALLAAVPRLGGKGSRLETIPGFVPAPEDFPAGCRFYGRCQDSEKCAAACASELPAMRESEKGHFCRCFAVENPESV